MEVGGEGVEGLTVQTGCAVCFDFVFNLVFPMSFTL